MSVRDPEELEARGAPVHGQISEMTRMGPVHLTVSELGRSISYYEGALGLRVLDREAGRARLGVGERQLLVLLEDAGAAPARGFTGLYHFALLVPERVDLARWLAHAARQEVRLVGLSDHFVSEALYLSDPDAHGIEIYWDRPRQLWEGRVAERMTTRPLDLDDLLGELGDPRREVFDGLPDGTAMGHVHLKVASLPETVTFYRDVLGFGLMAEFGSSAAFLGAGGYHHHLGTNTWESLGAEPAGDGIASLRAATIVLPDETERQKAVERVEQSGQAPERTDLGITVRDPSGNRLLLVTGS